tara:strand:- start:904 stop:1209 length:306 start_codon:yes stop_codon:yes gene_type:complete
MLDWLLNPPGWAGNVLTAQMVMEDTTMAKRKGTTTGGTPTNLMPMQLPSGYVLDDGTVLGAAVLANVTIDTATLVATIKWPTNLAGKTFHVLYSMGKYTPR